MNPRFGSITTMEKLHSRKEVRLPDKVRAPDTDRFQSGSCNRIKGRSVISVETSLYEVTVKEYVHIP